jgi:hypothetical protein
MDNGCPHELKKKRARCSRSSREFRRALPFRGRVGFDRIRARKAEGPMTDCRVAAEYRLCDRLITLLELRPLADAGRAR